MPFSDLSISPVYPTRFLNVDAKLPHSKLGFPLPCRRDAHQSLLFGVDSEAGFMCPGAPRMRPIAALNSAEFRRLQALETQRESDEEDEDLCPVECVKEFKTRTELAEILETAKESNALVVVDFYKTACGSCKYIEQGFIKLCKGAGDDEAAVIFLKHNVSLAVLLVSPCNVFFKQTLFIAFGYCLFIK
ncbi:hypothetical protein L7F22_060011 [Adiantum nelumboides]|nr:hypothetical protein [Adiantum nelumboides]